MHELYCAGPVRTTVSRKIVEDPCYGKILYLTLAYIRRDLVELDVDLLHEAAENGAVGYMNYLLQEYQDKIVTRHFLGVYFMLWNNLRKEFDRQFSEAAQKYPDALENYFTTHIHLHEKPLHRDFPNDDASIYPVVN